MESREFMDRSPHVLLDLKPSLRLFKLDCSVWRRGLSIAIYHYQSKEEKIIIITNVNICLNMHNLEGCYLKKPFGTID